MDLIRGFAGDDVLRGGDGHDWLSGGPGRDLLDGGDGSHPADFSSAASGIAVNRGGANLPEGGGGDDTLTGGGGPDTFVFLNDCTPLGDDAITDFGADDRLLTGAPVPGADADGLIALGPDGVLHLSGGTIDLGAAARLKADGRTWVGGRRWGARAHCWAPL